jgi:hypothetical protein
VSAVATASLKATDNAKVKQIPVGFVTLVITKCPVQDARVRHCQPGGERRASDDDAADAEYG